MRALALLSVFVAGCAATHPSDGSDRADVALYLQMHDAICARALQCARGAWFETPEGSEYTALACDAVRRTQVVERIVVGDWTVDTANARACLEALPTLGDCVLRTEGIDPLLPPRAVWPTLEASAHCDDAIDYVRDVCGDTTCPSGDLCFVDASCHGMCRSLPGPGDPCVGGQPCRGYDVYCRAATGTAGTCVARCSTETCVQAGHGHGCLDEACVDGGDAGDACDATLGPACQSDLVCDATGVCRVPASAGAPCAVNECDYGLGCDTSHTCVPVATAPCATPCPVGQQCRRDGTCSSSPDGLACVSRASGGDALAWLDTCPIGFSCTGYGFTSSVCRPVIAAGGRCTWSSPCIEGTTCRSGVCAPARFPLGPCTSASDCEDGFTCEDGVCAAPLGLCTIDADCVIGACADGVCRMRSVGAACATSSECVCHGGTCVEDDLGRDGTTCINPNGPDAICAQDEWQFCTPGVDGTARCCPR